MMKKILLSTMAAAVLSANDTELQSLKNQITQMEAMIKSMQLKIDPLEQSKMAAKWCQ